MRSLRILVPFLVLIACGGGTRPSHQEAVSPPEGVEAVQHVIIFVQENRSFDHYFGKLNDYRAMRGLPRNVDGLPDGASNPDLDWNPVPAFPLITVCTEPNSPAWNESHRQRNRRDPTSATATMDGFVYTAARFAQANGMNDTAGHRVMGYHTWEQLPYYYFMATEFGTSDRFFASLLSRTPPNRMYMHAATSAGYTTTPPTPVGIKTIWHLLEERGVSWRIYSPSGHSTLSYFQPFGGQHKDKVVPMEQYYRDLAEDRLAAVSFIEPDMKGGLDEHTANPQRGAQYAAKIINALMQSRAWSRAVFFLSWDEAGGRYDHVPPPPAPHPDGIAPLDLTETHTRGDFDRYGFRVPLIVVSPFARRHYVSHTVADFTAFLRFIQVRFGLPSLTARDAAQPDMTEFFDFANPPHRVPPVPPEQFVDGPCYRDRLP